MRFLHTSDWHVGRTVRTRSRLGEHAALFAEIKDIAIRERVDAMLVTGDVYHERRPPIEGEKLVAQVFADFAQADIPVICIAGNHDDPNCLAKFQSMGDLLGIHIVTDTFSQLRSLIKVVFLRDRSEKALVACLPYLHPHAVLTSAIGVGLTDQERLKIYHDKIQDYFKALEDEMRRIDKNAIHIVLAHLHISESVFGGGEWRSSVYPVNAGLLPRHVNYVALGHIHKAQRILGTPAPAVYAGSIMSMDFGESQDNKSVYIVEMHPGEPSVITPIELTAGKRLVRLHGTPEDVIIQASTLEDAWIEVVLRGARNQSELVEMIRRMPDVISVRFEEGEPIRTPKILQKKNIPPSELFAAFFRKKKNEEPSAELMALFARLYDEESREENGE